MSDEQLPDLVARIRLDTSELSAAPAKAAALGGAIGGALGVVIGGAVSNALGKLTDFVGGAVPAFAQLEDATAAAAVVFGDSMQTIIDQSEGARDTLGLTAAQVIDAANTFGTFGKSAGLAGDPLAEFSTEMTSLAGDLASFKGTRPEEAIQAIGAALRGESEPIRRYGVLLDDATLKARAMTLGIYEGTGALTPQQKVLAAQAEILAQTTDAQGDFARTMDSTANVAKRQEAAMTGLQTAIGGALAPAITAAKGASIGLIDAMTGLVERVAPSIEAFVGFVQDALSNLFDSSRFEGAGGMFDLIGQAVQPLMEAFRALGPTLAEVVPRILEVASAFSPVHLLIEALLPVLPQLADTFSTVIGALLTAVQPLLPVIADLVGTLGGVLSEAVRLLVPIILELADTFGGILGTVLEALTPVLIAVADVVSQLLPIILTLVEPLFGIVEALLPILEIAGDLIAAVLPPLLDVLVAILEPLGGLIGALVEALAPILEIVADLISALLVPAIDLLAGWLGDLIGWVLDLAQPVLGALVGALTTVAGWIGNVIGWVRNAISAFGNIGDAAGRMGDAIGRAWQSVVSWFRGLPGMITGALGNMGDLLYQAGRNVIDGLLRGIRRAASAVGDTIGNVVQTIRDFLPFSPAKEGPLSGDGSPELAGRKVAQMLADGMAGGTGSVTDAAGALARAASVNASGSADLAIRTSLTGGAAGRPPVAVVRVFIGEQELTHLVKGVVTDWASVEARTLTLGGAY